MLVNNLSEQRMCPKCPNKPKRGLEPMAICTGAPTSSGQSWAPLAAEWASVLSGSSWGPSGIRVSSQVASSLTLAPCFTFSVFHFIPSPVPSWPTDDPSSATRAYRSQSQSFMRHSCTLKSPRLLSICKMKPILLSMALRARPHGVIRADNS